MGIVKDNEPQMRLAEYDHYAKKSLIFGIIGLALPFAFLLALTFWSRLNHSSTNITNNMLDYVFWAVVIAYLTCSILGIVFGKKGLKSNKLG